ncbi:MAG: hypothetical protein JXX14_04950 [Deltaproteobacteria bacterium]|nr:hypothetical protein [Deltaproteobacteria bacterium]
MLYINVFCAVFWLSCHVFADDSSTNDDADSRARVAYQQGTELFAAEQYSAAAESFREANRQKPSWKIQYNIAQAESAAKRYGLALQAFELFLAEGGDEITVTRKDEVLAEIRRLREMVASVDVEGPPSAEVYVDGIWRGSIPLEGLIKITAGKRHEIKVVLDGEVLLNRTIRLSGGDETTLEVVNKDVPSESVETVAIDTQADTSPANPKPEHVEKTTEPIAERPEPAIVKTADIQLSKDEGKKLRTAAAVLLGVGSVVSVFGGVMGGLSMARTQNVKDLCDNSANECNTIDGAEAYDEAMGYGRMANILIPAGVAVAGTGLVMYLIGRSKREKITSLHIMPVGAYEGGAVLVAGRF